MKLLIFMDAHSQHCRAEHAELALTMRRERMDYFKTTRLEYDTWVVLAWWKSGLLQDCTTWVGHLSSLGLVEVWITSRLHDLSTTLE